MHSTKQEETESVPSADAESPQNTAGSGLTDRLRKWRGAVLAAAVLLGIGAAGFSDSRTVPPEDTPVTPETEPLLTESTAEKPKAAVRASFSLPEEPVSDTPDEPDPDEQETEFDGFTQADLDQLVDGVLESIITEEMDQWEQAYAVFRYTNKHVRYLGDSIKDSWQEGAYEGLTTGRGDCYTYYAVSRALLTALEIDNMEVTRSGGTSDHYWNLVNCGSGWYHFDAGPHNIPMTGPAFFMFTDQDAADYTRLAGRSYYSFDSTLYPERAAERAEYNPGWTTSVPKKKTVKPKPVSAAEPEDIEADAGIEDTEISEEAPADETAIPAAETGVQEQPEEAVPETVTAGEEAPSGGEADETDGVQEPADSQETAEPVPPPEPETAEPKAAEPSSAEEPSAGQEQNADAPPDSD